MQRKIALLLIIMLATAFFTGCNNDAGTKTTPTPSAVSSAAPSASVAPAADLSLPIVTDNSVTLTIWNSLSAEVTAQTDNLADGTNYSWAEAMKRTGINLKFIHPPATNETEQFQLMIASTDYPDIYKGIADLYTGGLDKSVEDGVWLSLNDLLNTFAPNYMNWVNVSDTNRKNSMTDTGNMVCVSQVYDRLQPAFVGYGIRQDWLDDLGLERPETYDDWYNVLTQFKNNKTTDGAGPLDLASTGIPVSNAFAGGFGVSSTNFIQQDGKVAFSQAEVGFREYLELMSKWYKEGLIDRDFLTNGGAGFAAYFPNNTRVANNETGATAIMYTYAGDYLARTGVAEEGANFTLTKWPVKEAGTNPPVAFGGDGAATLGGGAGAMIFTSCQHPAEAVRFIDYFYSEEGALLANYGIEGVTYEMKDGKPMQTELITKNPDGLTSTMAQTRYLIHNGFMLFILDREEDVQTPAALEYREMWAPTGKWNLVGNLTYTAEEGAERSSQLNDITTYVNEMTVKFIMGTEELTDSTWTAYVDQLKGMNVDRAIEITQSAYDRYQTR